MFYGSPLNQKDDKQKKDKPLTRAEWNKKYQGKLDTKKGPKGPGHSGRFNELIGKKVTSGDKGDSPLDIRRSLEEKIEETRKKAFIRSNSPSEQYEESKEEKRAQKKLKRLNKRLAKKEQK